MVAHNMKKQTKKQATKKGERKLIQKTVTVLHWTGQNIKKTIWVNEATGRQVKVKTPDVPRWTDEGKHPLLDGHEGESLTQKFWREKDGKSRENGDLKAAKLISETQGCRNVRRDGESEEAFRDRRLLLKRVKALEPNRYGDLR